MFIFFVIALCFLPKSGQMCTVFCVMQSAKKQMLRYVWQGLKCEYMFPIEIRFLFFCSKRWKRGDKISMIILTYYDNLNAL